MNIKNIEGLTPLEIKNEIDNGAKFVIYQYTISLLIITFKRNSDVYFVKNHEKAVVKGLPYTILTFLLGWWGIPWGPIYTIQVLSKNLAGGRDVTDQVASSVIGRAAEAV
jgi:hypothetical protein